ncbi:MAG: hypothetical protein LBD31_08295 [Treponema sp.]|jgi:hypothetical protein|nr:hypothetical protein [Treponema sp.]
MKKLPVVLAVCVLMFPGCKKALDEVRGMLGRSGSENASREENAKKLDREIRYYNDFLGISYAVPKGWWLYEVNGENFSETRGDITDDVSMDIAYGQDNGKNYANLWLLSFGNLETSTHDNHLGFELDARAVEGAGDMASFMDYLEAYMLEPDDNATYSLSHSEQVSINGRSFELRDYRVDRAEDDYQIMTLSCQVQEGYFFNIMIDYWPENTKAQQAVISSIGKSLEFY